MAAVRRAMRCERPARVNTRIVTGRVCWIGLASVNSVVILAFADQSEDLFGRRAFIVNGRNVPGELLLASGGAP